MNGKTIASVAFVLTAFLASCTEETELAPDNLVDESILRLDQTTLTKFESLGYEPSDVRIVNYKNPLDPSLNGPAYIVENDMYIFSVEQLDELVGVKETLTSQAELEQYRTTNLVTNNRTYSVIGYTGNGFALTSKMRTALQWSVNNYNRLNTGLRFSLSFAASTNADMVVYNNGASGGGGSAGFPSGGLPNKFIQINAGTDAFSTNVNEHVITHEMGHSVGFRHTDYFNRSLSCGTGGNEGSAGVGAILIPGTPSGTDTNSIMQACFGSNEDGEFGPFDIVALEFMY